MAIQLKAGMRLRSATDACEVVVVKAPADPVDLRCGGHPFLAADAAPVTGTEKTPTLPELSMPVK